MALHDRILRGEGGADVVSATLWPLGFSKELSSSRCIYIYIHTDREREREKKEKEQQEYGEGANFAALRIADDYLASAQCVGDAR